MYRLLGLREEKYIGQEVDGHNCDFTYTDALMEKHVLLLVDQDTGQKVELTLSEEQGECYSGWVTASWGKWDWRKVDTFAGKTHTVTEEMLLDIREYMNDYECNVITYSDTGWDDYYPTGGYSINMEVFKVIGKGSLDKRPVHIFYGDSNACKSYIAALTGKTVYETDLVTCEGELPDVLTEDIIVVGNRWDCNIDMIKNRLFGDPVIVEVNFKID